MIHRGFQFLQIPGPTNVPERILRAMAWIAGDLQNRESSGRISRIGHWCVGSRIGQYLVCWGPRIDVRNGPLCDAMA